jgi:hypothetical protein
MLPDVDLTFRVGDDSPFTYQLESVRNIALDEFGSPLDAGETVDKALVSAKTPSAQATLDYFALNTRYYAPSDRSLRMPVADRQRVADARLDARTRAWQTATEIARDLREADDPALRRALVLSSHSIVVGAGFWSTWATVLWTVVGDRDVLRDVLSPAPRPGALSTEAAVGGQLGRIPGTRSGWLS